MENNQNVPGKGAAVASLVLGIIAFVACVACAGAIGAAGMLY